MAAIERRELAERALYTICIGASGAVVVSVVSFALDLPLLATFGNPETVIAVFSVLFGVPAFWYFSRHPDATMSRSSAHVVLAGLFGLVAGVFVLIGLLIAGVSLSWGTTSWAVFVVGTGAIIGVPAYVLAERGALG